MAAAAVSVMQKTFCNRMFLLVKKVAKHTTQNIENKNKNTKFNPAFYKTYHENTLKQRNNTFGFHMDREAPDGTDRGPVRLCCPESRLPPDVTGPVEKLGQLGQLSEAAKQQDVLICPSREMDSMVLDFLDFYMYTYNELQQKRMHATTEHNDWIKSYAFDVCGSIDALSPLRRPCRHGGRLG